MFLHALKLNLWTICAKALENSISNILNSYTQRRHAAFTLLIMHLLTILEWMSETILQLYRAKTLFIGHFVYTMLKAEVSKVVNIGW